MKFESGRILWVRLNEIRLLDKSQIVIQRVLPPALPAPDRKFKARKMIEAFRYGIIPPEEILKFTFGRDAELKKIETWLNMPHRTSDSNVLLLEGEYGSGKTHLLDYLYYYALNRGWVVSRVTINPSETPPFKPRSFYREIISNLGFIKENKLCGFRELVFSIREKEYLFEYSSEAKYRELKYHKYMGRIIRMVLSERRYDDSYEDILLKWIAGMLDVEGMPKMYDYSTAASLYCQLINIIGWISKKILDMEGLLLLIDETENTDLSYYYQQFIKGLNMIRGLMLMANNDHRLLEEDIKHDERRGYLGVETGLNYNYFLLWRYLQGQTTTIDSIARYAWDLPSYVKIVFAVTPGYIKQIEDKAPEFKYIPESSRVTIEPLKEEDLKEMVKAIIQLYDEAYDGALGNYDKDRLFEFVWNKLCEAINYPNTRMYIKACVELLDIIQFNNIAVNIQ